MKPCPFCGAVDSHFRDSVGGDWPAIYCGECNARGPDAGHGSSPEASAKAWNRRIPEIPEDAMRTHDLLMPLLVAVERLGVEGVAAMLRAIPTDAEILDRIGAPGMVRFVRVEPTCRKCGKPADRHVDNDSVPLRHAFDAQTTTPPPK